MDGPRKNLHGQEKRYRTMHPSKKSLARERARLRGIINKSRSFQPRPELIGQINRHLKGWANYDRPGYSRAAFRATNRFVRERLARHLCRRSQRAWRPAKDSFVDSQLERRGLIYL